MPRPTSDLRIRWRKNPRPSTPADGQPGFAILFAYLAQAGLVDRADRIGECFLDQAADAIARRRA
jgi:hypothetical protein